MAGTLSPLHSKLNDPAPSSILSQSYLGFLFHPVIYSSKTTTKKSAPPECARSTLPCGARAARNLAACICAAGQIITITHERVNTNYNYNDTRCNCNLL
jgi:hypothetical protein